MIWKKQPIENQIATLNSNLNDFFDGISYTGDLNDAPIGIRSCSAGAVTNAPFTDSSAMLFTMQSTSRNSRVQLYFGTTGYRSYMYKRIYHINGGWSAWESNIVNKQATTSSAITARTWVDDFCNLPMPTQRAIYNIYNSNNGNFGVLIKMNDGKIRLSEDLQANSTIYISGVNS